MNRTNQSLIQQWCPEALAACPDFSIAPIEDFLPLLAGNAGASSSQVVTTGQVCTDFSATTTARLPTTHVHPIVCPPQQSGGIFPLAQGGPTMAPTVHNTAPPAPPAARPIRTAVVPVKRTPKSSDLVPGEDLNPGAEETVSCEWEGCIGFKSKKSVMHQHVRDVHVRSSVGPDNMAECRWQGKCGPDGTFLKQGSFRKHLNRTHLNLGRQYSYLSEHGLAKNCWRVPRAIASTDPQPAVASSSTSSPPSKPPRRATSDGSLRHHPYDRAPSQPKPGHLVGSTSKHVVPSISKLGRAAQATISEPSTPDASRYNHVVGNSSHWMHDVDTYSPEIELLEFPSFGVAAKTNTERFGIPPAFPWHADVLPSNPVRSTEVEVAEAGPSTPPNLTAAQPPIQTPGADVNPTPGPVDWTTLGFDLGDLLVGQSNLVPPAMNLDPLFSFSALEQSTLNFPSPPPEPVVEVQETQPVNADMQRTAEEILEIAQYCLFGSPAAETVDESGTGAHEEPEIDFSSFFREDPELYA
ncbi:hypothetical protein C8Q76DRAFT_785414 [Earliella scabrosa]|nr:hypothetical protein C8Q76DRAFT_785414 [Earliella scabrosa]